VPIGDAVPLSPRCRADRAKRGEVTDRTRVRDARTWYQHEGDV